MAKVENEDYTRRRGKLNKKDALVHRTRNGKEHLYAIRNPYTGPASAAQASHRKLFGKVNAIVNRIMNDPAQQAEWTAKKEEYNRSIEPLAPPYPERYETTRKFVFDSIREQLIQQGEIKPRKPIAGRSLPKGVKFNVKRFDELNTAELYEILKARSEVFVVEQGIRYPDEDNIDYISTHLFLHRGDKVVGYTRLFPTAEKGVMQMDRMLTTERGAGFGKYLLRHAVLEAKKQGATVLRMHAQVQTESFYKRRRFRVVSGVFIEADLPHVCMERVL